MKKKNDYDWTAAMELLPGSYKFKYIADGRWVEEVQGMENVPNPL
jgi:hypothetical protein